GHIPLVLLAAPVLVEVLIRRSFSGRKVLLFVAALVIAAGVAVPWFVMVEQRSPGAWQAMTGEVQQGFASTGHVQSDRWWFYFYRLAGGLLPWTVLLVIAWPLFVTRCRGRKTEEASGVAVLAREQLRFFLLAFCLGFAAFYAAPRQQEHYLLPLLPALALASGYIVSQFKFPGGMAEEDLAWSQLALGLLASVVVATLPLWASHCLAATETSTAAVAMLCGPTGWAITAPVALAVFLVHFFSARQFVEGKPLIAAIAIAVLAYCALTGWSWCAAGRQQQGLAIHNEAASLRERLKGVGPDVRVYSVGIPDALLAFYLERPVRTQKELAAETGAVAEPRALVLRRKGVLEVESAYGLKVASEEVEGGREFLVLPLPPGEDWPAKAIGALQQHERKGHK
ncbi:MAG: hypothetical protein NTW87_31970, partial [Planctomycetota bacterium]|nr:hypothetical protein [Planctomycetota bacterium]